MILDIERAKASWADNKLHLAFDVVPEGFTHLDLKTGEIFQSRRYATSRKQEDKAISATLFITRQERNAAGEELPSAMHYRPGAHGSDSEIDLIWCLPDDHLEGFHSLVLSGRTPRKVVVFFPYGALDFGWEPDGSGQKWDNEKSRSIPIEKVSFNFDLQLQTTDLPLNLEAPEGDDRAFFSDAASVNFILLGRLSKMEAALKQLSWNVGLITLLMLGLALSRFWH